jgi:MoxR-like ATPase
LLPAPPPWRVFNGGPLPETDDIPADDGDVLRRLGAGSHVSERDVDPNEVDMVNAALYLRRPLLVTGPPGCGKSSLAYRIARELALGRVLRWPITSLTTLKSGLYLFDAIGRAQAAGVRQAAMRLGAADRTDLQEAPREPPIGEFVKLGPLGTAFLPRKLPRVLLIDELDKSEADLPNDLLSIFEDGEFVIPELERARNDTRQVSVFTDDPSGAANVSEGRVRCNAFPMIVATSNGEREFPAAFLRRCLRLEIGPPTAERLAKIVADHLSEDSELSQQLVREFVQESLDRGALPTDKLLEAVYLATSGVYRENNESWPQLRDALWRQLSSLAP